MYYGKALRNSGALFLLVPAVSNKNDLYNNEKQKDNTGKI